MGTRHTHTHTQDRPTKSAAGPNSSGFPVPSQLLSCQKSHIKRCQLCEEAQQGTTTTPELYTRDRIHGNVPPANIYTNGCERFKRCKKGEPVKLDPGPLLTVLGSERCWFQRRHVCTPPPPPPPHTRGLSCPPPAPSGPIAYVGTHTGSCTHSTSLAAQ